MIRIQTQRLLPLLLLCSLLTACSIPTVTTTPTISGQTATAPVMSPIATPTQRLASMPACPVNLNASPNCFTPVAFQAAYGVTSLLQRGLTGKGQTIVDIVSFGSPTLQQDMDIFDQQFGLPAIHIQVIAPIHEPVSDPNNDRAGWAQETELDVEIIHAIAPAANIVVLTSPVAETEGTIGLPEFLQLEQYAVSHHLGNIVSQSWGASELTLQDQAGQQQLQQWNSFFQQATTKQGMTFFASSGDNGATDYTDLQAKHLATVATTSFPPDNPWVTAVGGTSLTNTGGIWSETVWNDGGNASGGGFSRFFPMPSYQKTLPASVQSAFHDKRGVPDVAGDADPNTGLAVYLTGQWTQAGGTSASAPLWAALMAIANQMAGRPLGFIDPAIYQLAASPTYAQDFHDITTGNNTNPTAHVTGYNAVAGWDPVTGFGSPNAARLLPDLLVAMKA